MVLAAAPKAIPLSIFLILVLHVHPSNIASPSSNGIAFWNVRIQVGCRHTAFNVSSTNTADQRER